MRANNAAATLDVLVALLTNQWCHVSPFSKTSHMLCFVMCVSVLLLYATILGF